MAQFAFVPAISFFFFFLVVLAGCGSGGSSSNNTTSPLPEDQEGFSATAVLSTGFETSALCPDGGIEIHTGIDVNKNGVLDQDEIDNSQELCHANTDRILTEVDALAPESECQYGGNRLRIGYDANANGIIDNNELAQTNLFCAQAPNTVLALLLYASDQEPAGENCSGGGTRIESGIDRNGNQVLDASEVSSIEYICDHNGPIRPYEQDDACEYTACDTVSVNATQVLVRELEQTTQLARVYDDGRGDITLQLADSAPEWLTVQLSDYHPSGYYWNGSGYYRIELTATNIPDSAVDTTIQSTVTVSDDTTSFDVAFSLTVIDPITITLDQTAISELEAGDNEDRRIFVKVTFDTPLPAGFNGAATFQTNPSNYMLSVSFQDNDETEYRALDNADFSVSWVGDALYRGQTEGTLLITIKDDYLPENTESYIITVGPDAYSWPYRKAFRRATLSLEIRDDADQAITASLSLATNTVQEASTADTAAELDFTITFDRALPSDATVRLELAPLLQESDLGGKDVGFNDQCVTNHYCSTYKTLSLGRGTETYTGTIKVRADQLKESNETFSLRVTNSAIGFILADLEQTFTVIDDETAPDINFIAPVIQTFYKTPVVNVPLILEHPTIDDIELSLSDVAGNTLIRGLHYDFAVSMPIVFSGQSNQLNVPVIIYGEEFEESTLSAVLNISSVSGASLGAQQQTELIVDKIAPFAIDMSDLNLPTEGQAYISREVLLPSNDDSVYLIGNIDGVIPGQAAQGSYDLFVAKYALDGTLIWARQFGSSSYDSIAGNRVRLIEQDSGVFLAGYHQAYHLSKDGDLTELNSLFYGINASIQDARRDAEGNTYLYGRKHYYNGDIDNDGSTTDFVLAKFDNNWNRLWISEDFTDLEPAHTRINVNPLQLTLSANGTPHLVGRTYSSDINRVFSTVTGVGNYDYLIASFDPTSGEAASLDIFGSDGNDASLHLAPYGAAGLIGFYAINAGDTVAGVTTSERATVQFTVDDTGRVDAQTLRAQPGDANNVRNFSRASNGTYFLEENASYSSPSYYTHLDADFNVIHQRSSNLPYGSLNNYLERAPVPLSDGAYLVSNDYTITKLTPVLDLRQE